MALRFLSILTGPQPAEDPATDKTDNSGRT